MYRSKTKLSAGKGHDPNCTFKSVDLGAARGGNIFYDSFHCQNFDMLWRNTEGVEMT